MAVCVDCGQLRLHHRGGRCSRCYSRTRTTTRTCGRCGRDAVMWGEGKICRRCRNLGRATGGVCSTCSRRVARLWGSRCTRCAKRHWTTGSCRDCWAWSSSITDGDGRCRACRELTARSHSSGPCRSCSREVAVNRYRRCRLCSTSRREAHLAGDPDWKLEPGARDGIQLFIGDVYRRTQPDRPYGHDERTATSVEAPAGAAVEQLPLFAMPAAVRPVGWPSTPTDMVAVELPDGLAAAVAVCAQARGWKPATTTGVLRAMTILTGLDSYEFTLEAVTMLRRHRIPIIRVREFLTASGLAVHLQQAPAERWQTHTAELGVQIRAEVTAWIEILEGHWGRGRARKPDTVRHYLNAAGPALTVWNASYQTLREVTTDEVATQLDGLHGSKRTLTAVALRSLFAALKTRRLVFVDPARPLSPGRFPHSPVLGLDDHARATLLATLPRPDHRVVVLLAGVHAMTRADMIGLCLDDIDLDAATMHIRGTTRPLDLLVIATINAWLTQRRHRWPASANPHLLVSYKSAYGLGPVSTGYFKNVFAQLPTTAAGLRADRLLAEAQAHGDPIRLVRLFGISPATAVGYCNDAGLAASTEAFTGDPPGPNEHRKINPIMAASTTSSTSNTLQKS